MHGAGRRMRSWQSRTTGVVTERGYEPEEEGLTNAEIDDDQDDEKKPTVTRLDNTVCDSFFRRAVAESKDVAALLGYFTYRRRGTPKPQKDGPIIESKVAVAVTSNDDVVYLGADYVRFVDSVVGGFDLIKMRIETADPSAQRPGLRYASAAGLYRGGWPVAVLMPLRYTVDDIPLDIPTAHQRAGELRQEPTPYERHLREIWLELGNETPWMDLAKSPFGPESFRFCQDIDDLIRRIMKVERHELGAAYAPGDVCFINLNSLPGGAEHYREIAARQKPTEKGNEF